MVVRELGAAYYRINLPGADGRIRVAIEQIGRFDGGVANTIKQLAASVGLSTSRFAHLFRDQTGLTPAQFLKLVKLREAVRLLEHTELSVKEVTAQAGFRNSSHFIRTFKSKFSVTPVEFRQGVEVSGVR